MIIDVNFTSYTEGRLFSFSFELSIFSKCLPWQNIPETFVGEPMSIYPAGHLQTTSVVFWVQSIFPFESAKHPEFWVELQTLGTI